MIQIIRANDRFFANHGWLKSYHSFSFGSYYDPNNMNFGPLRVLNDDYVAPLRGFGAHPHEEMEIVSIVLKGYLRHEDSTGESATTTFGGVQRMTAGTGVIHSEVNPSKDEEVNFLQLWFLPEEKGLTPSYENTTFSIEKMKDDWLPIVTKNPQSAEVAHIHQDLTIYLTEMDKGIERSFEQSKQRKTFVFVLEGEVLLNGGHTLGKRDSARIDQEENVTFTATKSAQIMLIDLP
ncbi:pirin family protein [Bacillus kexueae]|uniref:pirin family protein n=1 Tax=Aeribacillus kexueae TaxID=2078952 RepID=UPI001FB00665|nr:pirin family protein [Bacillus kexueae]